MKNLLIIRHAKSNMSFLGRDIERPLTTQGNADAIMMAKKIVDTNLMIDAFVSSTAIRAFTTATHFAQTYQTSEKNIIQIPNLYHASVNTFFQVITTLHNAYTTVALFSHNPGITDFVNQLTSVQIDDMPPCGVFAIKIHTTTWNDFLTAKKEYLFFDYPKIK
ncbi:MAG: histidine phosphatase family protein [Chitinophagaceae bacterium]|nr:histidine phosphatase family protein [Chitinophagaceae bacterium]MCW5906027.1 histidine phosphatase family protein [Chitinophagaceae bacterium]